MANPSIQQHEPLRIPSNWGTQERRFVSQLEEILDDVYKRFGRLKESDLGTALRKTIATASDDASSAKSTVEQTAEKFEAKFDSIGANGTETQTGITSITENGVKVEHTSVGGYSELNANGVRMYDLNGDTIGGVYVPEGQEKAQMVASSILNPDHPKFQIQMTKWFSGEWMQNMYGFCLYKNGKKIGGFCVPEADGNDEFIAVDDKESMVSMYMIMDVAKRFYGYDPADFMG